MSITHMTLVEFHKAHHKLEKNEVILDVRNEDEFAEAHIPNAINIPVTEVVNKVNDLRQYKTVYIHCKRGGRAKTAFEILKNAGLNNLVCIHDAGMDLWIESGFPVIKS